MWKKPTTTVPSRISPEVTALRPSDASAWSNRCWARAVANQELDKALDDANEALRLKAKVVDVDALNCRALIYLRLGHFGIDALAD